MINTLDFPFAEIHLDNLYHNISVIREISPATKLLAIVKGNAYGHGLLEMARALTSSTASRSVEGLGVGRLKEAVTLRDSGISHKILVLEGLCHLDEFSLAHQYKLDIVIRSSAQLQLLTPKLLAGLTVWLDINLGNHFSDLAIEEVESLCQMLRNQGVKNIILMTQFPHSRDYNNEATCEQAQRFKDLTARIPAERSAVSSSVLLNFPEIKFDWLRVGYMLYGYHHPHSLTNPLKAAVSGLKPLHKLKSRITQIIDLPPHKSIGYGSQPTNSFPMKVAVVQIGFGDGYPRNIPPGTEVMINDQRATIVGGITMDKIAVDLTGINAATPGDIVTLWGDGISIHDIANSVNHNTIELICRLSNKVTRKYLLQGEEYNLSG